jgi:hypothetical protein
MKVPGLAMARSRRRGGAKRRKDTMGGRGLEQHRAGLAIGLALMALSCGASRLEAAGSAYAVDTAEVGEPGNCKLES